MPAYRRVLLAWVTVLGLAAGAATASAEDAFWSVRLADLKLTEGKLPEAGAHPSWRSGLFERLQAMVPYAVLDAEGEAYVTGDAENWASWENAAQRGTLVVRAASGRDVSGRLFCPDSSGEKMVRVRFALSAQDARPEARTAFYQGKLQHYARLLNRDIPGGAWFRHEARLAAAAAGTKPAERPENMARWGTRGAGDLSDTYNLFTGGRAMSENLQLERVLPRVAPNEKPVPLESIQGISITQIDWKPLIEGRKPKLDPLAVRIPADQHAVFFATFRSAVALSDETKQHDTPVLRWAQPRSENADVIGRYERQLCLSMSTLGRLLGPYVAKSLALTGSDPFFPAGTDVAVLFETPQPATLEKLLLARVGMDAVKTKDAKAVHGDVAGLAYRGFRSPDRAVSSYVARLDGAVVVTNSLDQLKRLAAVRKGECESLAALPEFVFFRTRYKLGDPEETALVFLSDPAIRRWCGPRWRIADSRRTRAAAVMAELQAAHLDALVKGAVRPGPVYTDLPLPDAGQIELGPKGMASATYGTLESMTPIVEIPLTEVTRAEADAYQRWRDGYQRNWNWAFDPIALRLSLGKEKVAADMTVMPLIVATDYRQLAEISQGASLKADSGDPHGALAHFVLAVNRESEPARQIGSFLSHAAKDVGLNWIGSSISLYADDDPFWQDLAKVKEEDAPKFLEANVGRVPVAVRVEVADGLKLAAFLTAGRAYVEQSAPGLTRFESLRHREHPYTKVRVAEGGRGDPRATICYTTTGDALTVTLSENLLRRVIDRHLDRQKARDEGKPIPEQARPWLGSSAAMEVDRKILEVANAIFHQNYQGQMQVQAWGNLPILNQWKRRYPDRDPVAVHKRVWGTELVCPGGGKYVWNDASQTMESTVYGHPGEPKQGPAAPPVLSTFARGRFGLTFEHQGLRARAELDRPPPRKTPGEKP